MRPPAGPVCAAAVQSALITGRGPTPRGEPMSQELAPGAVPPSASSRTPWLVGGVLAAAALAAGAGMMMRSAMPPPASQSGAAALEAPAAPAPTPSDKVAHKPAAPQVAAAPACADCGVVESVRAVKRKGQASGVGAVAGGVLGAAVGNQFGKGNGRSAMTVLGAVGGGVAGHEIEKQAKSVVVQQVTVRMDDGSVRTIEQSTAPRVGERVTVQGKTLKPAPSAG
ncbi:MAG: glycine zipper 2TM domain-containing protein [Piscinibacter sp.]|nr:glycine zipper 2TM domain-containing protein [Piscinibacter sp.]